MFDQTLQDRRRNIVRQIRDHPRPGAGGDQIAVIDLQSVGLDQLEIFEAGKHPRQARNQLGVEFDGDDAGATFDEQAGQCAAPRPDFDDRLARPWRHRINNAARVMRAYEEILSETALGPHKFRSLWGWRSEMGSGEWGMGSGDRIFSPFPIPHSPFPTPALAITSPPPLFELHSSIRWPLSSSIWSPVSAAK